MLRSHNCSQLNRNNVGENVTLAGWVDRRRDHGGLIFIDLRDREGIVQVVFNPEISKECHDTASQLRNEFVILAGGEVSLRPAGTENLKLPSGEIEVIADNIKILNTSKTPPFYINEDTDVDENLRLKYRYLDLRRAHMKEMLLMRHSVVKYIRRFLDERGFIDIETPILIKSTPEGARDYLVPSRVYPGKFYALPQSPQQLKQLLMVAGVEKYYQIAKCFRDEDTRADRQPEFTQLDIEMSFVDEDDIISMIEDMFTGLVKSVKPEVEMPTPFTRITYADAMERYGCDKPDLRFGMEIKDISDIAAKTDFAIFKSIISEGGKVKAICAAGCGGYSRQQLNELIELSKEFGAKGLVTIALDNAAASIDELTSETIKSVAAKYLSIEHIKEIASRLEAAPGDLLLIVAGGNEMVTNVLGRMRLEMGKRLNLMDPNLYRFAFVVDFPLLDWNKEENHWQPMHHPFTSPREQDISLLDETPEKAFGRHYDMVLNGYEIAGGSIRIHRSELQKKVFNLMGYTDTDVTERFGHLLEAFKYGAPPHGGIAAGIDRILMIFTGAETIREVIPFPKNQNAADLLFDAPSEVSEEQLKELHIRLREE